MKQCITALHDLMQAEEICDLQYQTLLATDSNAKSNIYCAAFINHLRLSTASKDHLY